MGLLKEVTLSSPPLNAKSSVTSKKNFATSPSTSNKKWPPLLLLLLSKNLMNSQMVKLSPLVTKDSVAQKPSSNHPSLVWNPLVFMKPLTTPSCSAILISVKIFTLTMSSPVVPLCTQVLLIVCKKKSPLLPHLPWRSRSSPHQNVNTLSGLVVPSLLPFLPSKLCGSLNKNTMKQDHPLSTENAFKYCVWNLFWFLCATTTPRTFQWHCFCLCIYFYTFNSGKVKHPQ